MQRVASLGDRTFILSQELMEIAYEQDGYVYLSTYTQREGAPLDASKMELQVKFEIFQPDGSPLPGIQPRFPTLTIYDDPSGAIGTPEDHDPVETILGDALASATRAVATVARITDPVPLFERLAPSE